jgi:hypothetical protein
MSKPLTKRSTDYSGTDSFSFGFFCDICGNEWKSPTVLFETDGMTIEHEEARTLLWAKEHNAAFEQSNVEARINFNKCPICGKWVCDSCFVEKKEIDMCRECGEQ